MKAESELHLNRNATRDMRARAGASVAIAMVAGATMFVLGATSARAADAPAPEAVVATVGDHPITQAELEKKIRPQMAVVESRVYDLKKEAIEVLADDYLIEQAAKKQNLSPDDYLKKQLLSNTAPATDADAKKFYDEHKAQIPKTETYDKVKDRIIQLLNRQRAQAARDAMLTELRKNEPIKVLLVAPRVEVASAGHPELGAKDAPVTIVEFADFQCPYCKGSEDSLKGIRDKYGAKVRLVYMDYPLSFHAHAFDAAKAARCANEQDKFWPYHDVLFTDQAKLTPADLKADAKKLGLDTAKFNE
ncbi:MAG TPA: thioredoxin domain-containing protein, partial [Candidatus Binataceae bacterium]